MASSRTLIVVADDYGIGRATSAGILRAAQAGAITGTVLLVNSPFAHSAVAAWQKAGVQADLGWHPCLTIDQPLSPPDQIASLVGRDGSFHSLGGLMVRLAARRIRYAEVVTEFTQQLRRYRELTGAWPALVNSHHHVQVFPLIGAALCEVLATLPERPFLRRVREPARTLALVPGARAKRLFLSRMGQRATRRQIRAGFPGSDWLVGITDPVCVHDPEFFTRWLRRASGNVVELTCHPGELDDTLLGRDATPEDGQMERRVRELDLLLRPSFQAACAAAGFHLQRATSLPTRQRRRAA